MMKPTITWSLVEVGRCESCRNHTILWTHSHANRITDKQPSMPILACAECFRRQARFITRYSDEYLYDNRTEREFMEAVLELIYETAPLEVEKSDFPYLETLKECDSCRNFIGEGQEVKGFRQDNLKPLTLHRDCSITTRCCQRTYPSGFNRDDYDMTAVIISLDGQILCRICLNEYLEANNETLEDDYFVCHSCDGWRHQESETQWGGNSICENCYDNHVYTCSDCNDEYWDGDDHDCSDSYGGLIHDYSYKPRPYFFGKRDGERIYMGFELEVEVRDGGMREHAERVSRLLGEHVYLKYDGSLDHGFEIVTHPHSLDSYRQEFAFDSFRRFRQEGLRSWDTRTCGLHVHVSRTAFGTYDNRTDRADVIKSRQLHELRFIKLIYDNERQVTRLAGRSSPSYANFMDKGKLYNKVMRGYTEGGRHAAVNTDNENTLEVRVFKGSLNERRVMMALEFVHSAVEYTRNLKVNGKNNALSWLAFSGYVHDNQEQYPNLHAIMLSTLQRDIDPSDNEE